VLIFFVGFKPLCCNNIDKVFDNSDFDVIVFENENRKINITNLYHKKNINQKKILFRQKI